MKPSVRQSLMVLGGLIVLIAIAVAMAVRLGREAPASASEGSVGSGIASAGTLSSAAADSSGDAARITVAEFLPLHDARGVLVIDVRGEGSFRDGHIPGAINIDAARVRDRVTDILALAAGRPIVTYCSCVNEHSSAIAAVRLTEAGAPDVRALIGGYPEWVAQGGPVAKGDGSGE